MDLRTTLAEAVKRYREKIAITMGDRQISFTRLDEDSNRIANALLKMGVNRGDRVAVLLPNCPEFAAIYFGVVKAGGVAVLLDIKYKATELVALFHDCQPRVVFADDSQVGVVAANRLQWRSVERVVIVGGNAGDFLDYQEVLSASTAQPTVVPIAPGDMAHIAYTSGPTLAPRGVVMSHQSLVAEAKISAAGFQQTDKDIEVLFALPLHHAFGLVVILLTSIYSGSRVVMLPGLSIGNLMEVIERERVTMFMAVPFIYGLMVSFTEEERQKRDLNSLRLCGSAGAALPIDTTEKFRRYYGRNIIDFWGMTESAGHITCQSVNGQAKTGSVGRVLPGWELKIVDDDGRGLPAHQRGEIIARGPMMSGYYRKQTETANVIRNGWLHTGDMGWLDEDGELFLTGIKRDMIIAKGQNIYPSDIETVLDTHPGVAAAAVVGVSDAARGQIVQAVVQLKAGETVAEQEIKKYCLERLANYKVPKQVVFVDSLPRDAYGKIDKGKLH